MTQSGFVLLGQVASLSLADTGQCCVRSAMQAGHSCDKATVVKWHESVGKYSGCAPYSCMSDALGSCSSAVLHVSSSHMQAVHCVGAG